MTRAANRWFRIGAILGFISGTLCCYNPIVKSGTDFFRLPPAGMAAVILEQVLLQSAVFALVCGLIAAVAGALAGLAGLTGKEARDLDDAELCSICGSPLHSEKPGETICSACRTRT